MDRDLERLTSECFDVIIVGGGIYGACAAWDAALRGLSVALIEQGDFGQATSSNSQKIVHGGLRYLQTMDVARMRESIRERSIFLRIAPHLVNPLPCLMPTNGSLARGRAAMRAALRLNDWISWDRNSPLSDPAKRIPKGRLIPREECLRLVPTIKRDGITGAAVWYDGQIFNSERLTLAFVLGSVERGACVANYTRVNGFIRDGNRVIGVRAHDLLEGRRLEIRGRIVLNTAGPWVGQLLGLLDPKAKGTAGGYLKAINLITRPLYSRRIALGLSNPTKSETSLGLIFVTPWRDRSIVGTMYRYYRGEPEGCGVTEEEIREFLQQVNASFPAARLIREDVCYAHVGLLPAAYTGNEGERVPLRKHYRLVDHEKTHGVGGVISVQGVKYTTARDVAEKAVSLVLKHLGRPAAVSPSRWTPLPGGNLPRTEEFLTMESRSQPRGLHPRIVRQLIHCYGSQYGRVLAWIDEDRAMAEPVIGSAEVIRAQIRHAVRKEMARKLSDVVFRRTDLATVGHPGETCLRDCAAAMAKELGWNAGRVEEELSAVRAELRRHAAVPAGAHASVPEVQLKVRRTGASEVSL